MEQTEERPAWAMSLRRQAQDLFQAGIDAADPARAVARHLAARDGRVEIVRESGGVRTGLWAGVRVVAFGKAAPAMARAAGENLPDSLFLAPGVVVTNYENAVEVPGFDLIAAGHPLPDANGVKGAAAVARVAEAARADELILVLISGGGSALLPYPVEGLTLKDKVATTDLLLASGADIGEVNTVRKHLSRLKGGGLARLTAPADLHAFILSDVLGDDLSSIASGPTVPDPTTFADARDVLVRHGIWEKVPKAVREHISRGLDGATPETPKPGDPVFERAEATLVGGNSVSLAALREAAQSAGLTVRVYSDSLTGEARDEADRLAAAAAKARAEGGRGPRALIAGGETTVTIKGKGTGGRNQEMALAFALAAERHGLGGHWVFLSGGTDGRDGPTEAAGGLVDPGTLARIRAGGGDPQALLADNDSHAALERAGDLLVTGATGTNVADLQVLLLEN